MGDGQRTHRWRRVRGATVLVVLVVLVVGGGASGAGRALGGLAAAGASEPAPAVRGGWVRPVDGPVVRRFEEPRGPYGPGHRGVDLSVPTGTSVGAVGPGTVEFAGPVAGEWHVVVRHAGGLRTTYAYLGSIEVGRGDVVDAGARLGTAGWTDSGHGLPGLHLGLRRGDRYLDPMVLFRIRVPAEVVRLVPDGRLSGAGP